MLLQKLVHYFAHVIVYLKVMFLGADFLRIFHDFLLCIIKKTETPFKYLGQIFCNSSAIVSEVSD